jgi:prepilin-type N-terminal cleavage/methylation domain-containing protein
MRIRPGIRKDETGFTMTEVMVVIGIIAILATAAIPSFSIWLPDYRLKRAVQDLYSNMQLAKMEAVKSNSSSTITFSTEDETYTKPDNTTVSFADYGSGIGYERPDSGSEITYADGESVTFQTRGLAEQGEVYISNDKGTFYYVGTSIAGVVILRKWNGSAWE